MSEASFFSDLFAMTRFSPPRLETEPISAVSPGKGIAPKVVYATSKSFISELCDSENSTLPAGAVVVPVKPDDEL